MTRHYNTDDWYVWEQNCSPMLLTLTLNAAFNPLREYIGSPFPNTPVFYETDKSGNYQAKWLIHVEECRALGRKMIEMLLCPQYRAAYEKFVAEYTQRAVNKANEILSTNYTIKNAVDVFEEFEKIYYAFYKVAWFAEPVQFQTEYILTRYLKDTDKLKALLTIDEDTFSIDILRSLRDCKAGKITAEAHSQKYHWCKNNYYETKFFSPADVLDEIKDHPVSYYENLIETTIQSKEKLLKQKQEILSTLPSYYQNIVNIANNFGAKLIDDRKKTIMLCNSAFDKLLVVIAKATNTIINNVRLLIPQELRYFTANAESYKHRFEERKKLFLCVQTDFPMLDEIIERTDKILPMLEPFIAEGETAEKALAQINTRLNLFVADSNKSNKLNGVVAYHDQNEFIGTVHVIKNPKQEKLIDGEILVAPSTTPDYLTAINKCSAIITDWGGQTSHAAIVSRELKKPCIIGTNYATSFLQTGQRIKINFADGTIEVLK